MIGFPQVAEDFREVRTVRVKVHVGPVGSHRFGKEGPLTVQVGEFFKKERRIWIRSPYLEPAHEARCAAAFRIGPHNGVHAFVDKAVR